ncbi:MAG: DEAD/DEAH box helicase [Sandaracinaceae bacterium]|nr:DEAD/DEAH box helicase [Sandaracinaceae bacterium]
MSPTDQRHFSRLAEELRRRTSRATVSQTSPASDGLRRHLLDVFGSDADGPESFLAPPLFEALFEWARHPAPLSECELLHDELKRAISAPKQAYAAEAFPLTRAPYVHQVDAWRTLIEDRKSIVVTTGTASGKTECFLVPILDDLARERAAIGAPTSLSGVRALFLYPLNALINSQRDRLLAWTSAFGDSIRFCLYNGNTPEDVKPSAAAATPNEVRSRRALRRDPPPILVTNATMLEYMMIRAIDAPIVEGSRGRLRWIVLDEAHTYLGSAAAELSLLLRRVMHAFDVRPEDVRFVATSATIGEKDAEPKLQAFLADLAGIPVDQVRVVTGQRLAPPLPEECLAHEEPLPSLEGVRALDDEACYPALARSAPMRELRARANRGPVSLADAREVLGTATPSETLAWLDEASRATERLPPGASGEPPDEHAFLPLRGHFMTRSLTGLWACVDRGCGAVAGTTLAGTDWPFGAVYRERRTRCACGAIVLEVVLCNGCGEAYLAAAVRGDRFEPCAWEPGTALDDDEADDDETDEEGNARALRPTLFAGPNGAMRDSATDATAAPVPLEPREGSFGTGSGHAYVAEMDESNYRCGRCGALDAYTGRTLRAVRLGAPFLLGVGIPAVLEQLPPDPRSGPAHRLPAEGRKLITFTDSRQGTARFALRGQLEAERNFVRATVYHTLWGEAKPAAPDDVTKLRQQLDAQRAAASQLPAQAHLFEATIAKLEQEIAAVERASARGALPWRTLESRLAAREEVRGWMRASLRERYAAADLTAQQMARVLLLRELMRRPKRQGSLETLGLVRFAYPSIDAMREAPGVWREAAGALGGDVTERWRELLRVSLDYFVRSLGAVTFVDPDIRRWLGVRMSQPAIVDPDGTSVKNRLYPWPRVPERGRLPRLARVLARALRLDPTSSADRAQLDEILRRAFRALVEAGPLAADGDGYRLPLHGTTTDEVLLETVDSGFVCPITRRVLSRTLEGVSPFATEEEATPCDRVEMPRPRFVFGRHRGGSPASLSDIHAWLETDPRVRALRERGLWTEFSDRIASFSPTLYHQSAEHSAQVDKNRLIQLEKAFKEGRVNVLSCSTTMEMGVDIGGLAAVAMNNVPPGPANYQQRAGRAGRRGEARATVLTLCQGSPHGAAVFANPSWPFTHPVHVPAVSLGSERIVQRHVHSVLLAAFLRSIGAADAHTMRCDAFFLASPPAEPRFADYLRWLDDDASDDSHVASGLELVTRGTALAGRPGPRLEDARRQLRRIADAWLDEHEALTAELDRAGGRPEAGQRAQPAQRAIWLQVRRMREEYLLRTLASGGYLPSYGFPLHVVPFVYLTMEQIEAERNPPSPEPERDEGFQRARGFPSRQVERALLDYAPGSGVVIDGMVYESRGVTLSWQLPTTANGEYREVQSLRYAWLCKECGKAGDRAQRVEHCASCGSSRLAAHRYLEPAGFATAIAARPDNDLSKERYVRREPSWISAGGAPWQVLADPRAGRFRYDPDGYVHHHSAGEHGGGYAVCLHCGYAESQASGPATISATFRNHRRLRGGGERGTLCEGAAGDFGVVEHLRLGASTRTDVVELQLDDPRTAHPIEEHTQCVSIAVALRDALARRLGVDPREIGWAIGRSAHGEGLARPSIVLFDAAQGGAGYVATVASDLHALLQDARALLDCPQRCDAACHGCLLSYDTQAHVERLDRHRAREALSEDLVDALRLPEALQAFGPETRLETLSLRGALFAHRQRAGIERVRVHLGGATGDWDYDAWSLRDTLRNLRGEGVEVTVVVPERAHAELPWDEANTLAHRLESDGFHVALSAGDGARVGEAWLVLEAEGPRSARWAATDPVGLAPNERWAGPGEAGENARYVGARLDGPLPPLELREASARKLLKPVPNQFVEIAITGQLNGAVAALGGRFWSHLTRRATNLRDRLAGKARLVEVEYTDRYVHRPVAARVLYEVLRALRDDPGGLDEHTVIRLRTAAVATTDKYPDSFAHDWREEADQRRVLEALLAQVGGRPTVDVQSKHQLPHHRELVLRWSDESTLRVRLDHGLSFLAPTLAPKLDFRLDAAEQARRILAADFEVHPLAAPVIVYVN